MKKYEIITSIGRKPNDKNWWIDQDMIRNVYIEAATIEEAILKYKNVIEEEYYIPISINALKNKNPIYRDLKGETVQVGFIITGKTSYFDNNNKEIHKYIDIWLEISKISIPEFNQGAKK